MTINAFCFTDGVTQILFVILKLQIYWGLPVSTVSSRNIPILIMAYFQGLLSLEMGVWPHPVGSLVGCTYRHKSPLSQGIADFVSCCIGQNSYQKNETSDDLKAKLLLLRDLPNGMNLLCHGPREPLSNAFGSKHKKNKERKTVDFLAMTCGDKKKHLVARMKNALI